MRWTLVSRRPEIRARVAVLAAVVLALASCGSTPVARTPGDPCAVVPIGAIAPAPGPGWCGPLPAGASTAAVGPNAWLDDFAGASHAALSADYVVFEAIRARTRTYGPSAITRTQHFSHNGHWMVDLQSVGNPTSEYEGDARDLQLGANFGGAAMRPRTPFALGAELAIEVDVSAAMDAYHEAAWPEIVITTAPAPTGVETDPLHAAGVFGGASVFGCRLEPARRVTCDERDPSGTLVATWRTSAASAAWRECRPLDPDASCRDRFRLILRADGPSLSVGGVPQALAGPAVAISDAFARAPLYVYFASWGYLPAASIVRLHWGRIAIGR